MKRPKTSSLSLKTRLNLAEQARDTYQEALEAIADILEDLGIIDGGNDDPEPDEPSNPFEGSLEIIPGTAEKVE